MIAVSLMLLAPVATVPATPIVDVAAQAEFVEAAVDGGRYIQARDMLARLRELPAPKELQTKLALLAGQVELAEHNDTLAESEFAAVLDTQPDNCIAVEGLGIAAARQNKRAFALAQLKTATTLCPDRWQSWNSLGVVADQSSDWTVALQAYERADQLSPSNVVILNNYGYSLYLQGRSIEAESVLRIAVGLAPGDQRLANNLDIAVSANGEPLSPKPPGETPDRRAQRLNNAGYAALKAGDVSRARALLSEALQARGTYFSKAAANMDLAGK
jgi:Tfp pilus assembly protein PilF